jgi:hypothetical protein
MKAWKGEGACMSSFQRKWREIKDAGHLLAHDKPGRRFRNYHNRSRTKLAEHPVKRALVYIVAGVLIIAGFMLGFVPGAPGFFLGIPGLALIASRSKALASLMDKGELSLRWLFRKIFQR